MELRQYSRVELMSIVRERLGGLTAFPDNALNIVIGKVGQWHFYQVVSSCQVMSSLHASMA